MWVIQFRALMSQVLAADARRLDGHAAHGATALLIAIVVGPLYGALTAWAPGSPGLNLFEPLIGLLYVMSTAFACYLCARIISEEQAQETYGLLLLTGLGPGAFLLAKTISHVAVILFAIAVTVPFWFLCVTFGGVMPVQVLACVLVLGANLIVVSQIATLCAACFEGHVRPVFAAVIGASLYTLIPMVAPSRPPLGAMGLRVVLAPGFNDFSGVLRWSLIAIPLAAALFGTTWRILARRGPPEGRAERSPVKWKEWLSLASGSPLRPRPGRVWQPAITWKEFYESIWGWEWFIGMTFLIGPVLTILLMIGFRNGPGTSCLMSASLLAIAAVCDGASEMFGREVRRQTWDSLRLVPNSLRQIFWRKFFGRLPGLAPACFLLIPGFVLATADVEWLLLEILSRPIFYVLAGMYFLAAGCLTVTVMCYRSITRNPLDAFIYAVGIVVLTLLIGAGLMPQNLSPLMYGLMIFSTLAIVTLTLIMGREIRRILEGEV